METEITLTPEWVPRALERLLRPIVRLCLRNSLVLKQFTDVLKRVYAQEAKLELERNGAKPSAARISVLAGIRRNDIPELLSQSVREAQETQTLPQSLLSRVLAQWQHNKRFTTKSGAPRVLRGKGDAGEFAELVQSVSKHAYSGAVLSELRRSGHIEETPRGLRLRKQMYGNPRNLEQVYDLLSRDMSDLIGVVEENSREDKPGRNLHLRTSYDNIFVEDLAEAEEWLLTEGKAFHKRARRYLAERDLDVNPDRSGERLKRGGGFIVLTSFSRILKP